jgi:hypothetical protein
MYRSIGEDPLIFLPGAIQPRRPLPVVHESTQVKPPTTTPRLISVHESTPSPVKPSVPVLLPEAAPPGMPEEKSMLPYLIVGGLVLVGGAIFLMRK